MNAFGRGLRLARLGKDLRLEELAVRARIPWATVVAIETGKRFPSLFELERLLKTLDVNLNEVMRLAKDRPTIGIATGKAGR